MRILMLEDTVATATATRDILKLHDESTEVDLVVTLAEAKQKIAENNCYDVALVDLNLPDASGIEAPRTIKSLCPDTVIIVITGDRSLPLALELIRIGIQNYIVKAELSPSQLIRDIYLSRERQHREISLNRKASTDELTGTLNRRGLLIELKKSLAQVNRLGVTAALCTLDIDSFKGINDRYGHPAGDAVLKEFAQRLSKNIRTNDQIGRIGGDEFWVILNGIENSIDLNSAARKLVDCCNEPCRFGKHLITYSSSVGIAVTQKKSFSVKEWIRKSDEALYMAKNAGKNCYRFCTNSKSLQQKQEDISEQEFKESFI